MIEQIDFKHFFMEIKNYKEIKWANPYSNIYLKYQNTYAVIEWKQNTCQIGIVINKGLSNLDFYRNLFEICRKSNIQYVEFVTSTNNKIVNSLAKYYKANLIEIKYDFYEKNENANVYLLDLNNSKRFKKAIESI
jgi:hypothetical protein